MSGASSANALRQCRAPTATRAAPRRGRRRASSSCACARTRRSRAAGSLAGQDRRLRAELLRQLDRPQDPLALRRRQPLQRRRLDVDGGPLDAELRREPRRAAHDVLAARARADAAQQRSLGLPDALDRLVGAVGLDVVLDAVGGAAQRELAQRHQVALAEEVARRALDLLGQVDLAGLEAREQVVGGNVDQHHLVGLVEERVGHRLPDRDAGDAADDVVQAFEVLDVERREDVDAGSPAARRCPASASDGASPATLVCASSSTRISAGWRASAASRSNSVSVRPWYSISRARQDLEALRAAPRFPCGRGSRRRRRRRPCLRCAAPAPRPASRRSCRRRPTRRSRCAGARAARRPPAP